MILIGDVHGCYETLMRLFEKLPNDEEIVFLGDLVDKGSDTKKVLDFIIQGGYRSVMGNHDYLMGKLALDCYHGKLRDDHYWLTYTYGGRATMESYGGDVETLEKHTEWLNSLPIFLESDALDSKGRSLFITHGFGLPYYARRTMANKNEDIKTAILGNRLESPYKEDWEDISAIKNVVNVFGHVALPEVRFGENYIGVDTGCVYGYTEGIYKGGLSAVSFENRKVYFQENVESQR